MCFFHEQESDFLPVGVAVLCLFVLGRCTPVSFFGEGECDEILAFNWFLAPALYWLISWKFRGWCLTYFAQLALLVCGLEGVMVH